MGAGSWSLTRYQRLRQRLKTTVDARAAWAALAAVATGSEDSGTLHSLVVYPESRCLDLAFAAWKGGVLPAAQGAPTRISFDQLFLPPGEQRP